MDKVACEDMPLFFQVKCTLSITSSKNQEETGEGSKQV